MSHHPTAEARDMTAMTSLRLLAVLNVLFNIWFAPGMSTYSFLLNVGLRQYIRPLGGTALVPGHDGVRTSRSS